MSADATTPAITFGGDDSAAETPRPRFCYSRFWMDLTGSFRCTPTFQPVDVLHKTDGSAVSKVIDIPASFSPPMGMKTENKAAFGCAKAGVIIWKLVVFLFILMTFLAGFVPYPNAIWFAYLTNWALFIAMIYSALSLVNSIFPISTTSNSHSNDDNENTMETPILSTRTKVTWVFFTLAAVAQSMVTVLYWTLLHPPGLPALFLTSMIILHGGVCVFILIDGLMVNRIPIRFRHWLELCLPLFASWVIWSVIQSPLGLDLNNAYMDMIGLDDDKIYPVVDWEEKPLLTLALVSICGLVVSPIVHFALAAFSMVGRKYIDASANKNEKTEDDCDLEAVIE